MADPYAFTLLAELGENDIPRLKNKLVKYFQSKKSSGGDCAVELESGGRRAAVRFRREEDQKNVLAKETHHISLGEGVLKVTVRLPSEDKNTTQETPSDEGKKKPETVVPNEQTSAEKLTPTDGRQTEAKGDTAEEELCSTSAVLENITEGENLELLEMLVENILKATRPSSALPNFTLEVIPDSSSAVVTFQSGKVNADFIEACPLNRVFKKKKFSIRPLEVTTQIAVENIENLHEDVIHLYFEREGGIVDDLKLNEVEASALITFEDCHAVKKVMMKKHHITKQEVRVYPFYQSLGVALYGKDKPAPKLPAAISEPIDSDVWRYLTTNQAAAKTICGEMEKHFCAVNLDQSTIRLSPLSSLLKQKDAKAIMTDWRNSVKSAFAQAMSKFKSLKFPLESEVWEESEEKLKQSLLNEDVVVVPEKNTGVLSVVGLVDDVNRLERQLSEVLSKIMQRVTRQKNSETKEISVPPSIFHILSQDGLQDKLLQVSPELRTHYDRKGAVLKVTGFLNEIFAVGEIVNNALIRLKRENLGMDKYVFDMLKDEEQEELTVALLTSNGINAALEISAQRMQVIAVSDKELVDAQDHLRQLLISHPIDVEDADVLKKPEWQKLVGQLELAGSESYRRTQIHVTPQRVVVSGHKDSVKNVSQKLSDFLTQNVHVEESIDVEANVIIEYLQSLETPWLKDWEDKATVSFSQEAISLSGARAAVKELKTLLEDAVSSIVFDSLKVSKPGVKKLFQDKESTIVASVKRDTGCLVQLVDKDGEDWTSVEVQKPVYQIQTSDGVKIFVCKADMCSYPVMAVVSPSVPDLQLGAGLGRALLRAAGPQLQDECDRYVLKGHLRPGDCVITGAGGRLCCQKIIHAVGPDFELNKSQQKAVAQLRKAVRESLELAGQHGCISVALPAIGRNQSISLHVCTGTIVKAVKEYCEEKYDENPLKAIHLVDNNDGVVKAMESAVRQEFGNHGISHSTQPLPGKVTKSPQAKQVVVDPHLYKVQTKEGLDIILTKGDIQAATTEVIVNTVSEDLDLTKGAVSEAILVAAGPRLQQLLNAQDAAGALGEVIPTDGGNLKCRQVYHVVAPSWDKDKDASKKTLSGIFKDCLSLADKDHMTSISFPAIGTGNLGFPKALVASLLLDKIVSFSSQKQHLKKVVIVLYPGDAQTIKEFSDEFVKKFPNVASEKVGPFSKVVSSSGMYETTLGNVTVQAVTGDITKETTDVIVNSSNQTFSLKSGVSKAILEAAGPAVEKECQGLAAQANPGMIMTQPGNLKCKKILHLIGQTDPIKINKVVKDALEMCVQTSQTSVSFPAIGTGQGNVKARQVADSMLDAAIDVLSKNPSSTLTTIRIVVFQSQMLKDFCDSMHQREATGPKDKEGTWYQNLGSKFKSFFISETAEKPQKKEDLAAVTVKVDPVCFHICGDTQAEVDSAKKRLYDLISKDLTSTAVTDSDIFKLSDADRLRLTDIQKKMGVGIRYDSGNGEDALIIEGLPKDVLLASREIDDMLRKMRSEFNMKSKLEFAGTVVQWQYKQNGQFQSFDALTNYRIEEAYQTTQPSVVVTVQGQNYTLVMPDGPATDSQGTILQTRRIDKIKGPEVPDHWESMPVQTTCLSVPIAAGTQEYTDVSNLFQATCQRTITKIERIQNPTLWKTYQAKKHELEVRNKHPNNEKRLFHGTSEDTASIINEHGFNRSFAGMNAACYGRGSYFAVDASYSASDTYSKPSSSGDKLMYLCQVLTGEFCVGQQGMISAPQKGNSREKYNSVVDNISKPVMFVIFHDNQAYPEYMITFK